MEAIENMVLGPDWNRNAWNWLEARLPESVTPDERTYLFRIAKGDYRSMKWEFVNAIEHDLTDNQWTALLAARDSNGHQPDAKTLSDAQQRWQQLQPVWDKKLEKIKTEWADQMASRLQRVRSDPNHGRLFAH